MVSFGRGNEQWRIQLGIQVNNFKFFHFSAVFKTNSTLIKSSASLDKYIRRSDRGTTIDKWFNGAFQAESIFRKTESDWNMAYLALIGI